MAVFGNFGPRNLGDEATLAAFIGGMRPRGVEVVALSFDPDDTARRHGVRAVPLVPPGGLAPTQAEAALGGGGLRARLEPRLRTVPGLLGLAEAGARGLRGARRAAREPRHIAWSVRSLAEVDALVFGGGGHLTDLYGGAWGSPWLLLRLAAAARVSGGRVAFASIGAGPLRARTSRALARGALALADSRTFRDEASLRLVRSIGARGPLRLAPDMAFWHAPPAPARAAGGRMRPTVGLNLFPHEDPRYVQQPRPGVYEAYVEAVAEAAAGLIEDGVALVLIPTQLRADPPVGDDVREALARRAGAEAAAALAAARPETVDDVLRAMQETDAMVAGRYHGILLSCVAGVPVVATPTHSRMQALARQMGLEHLAVPADGATGQALRRSVHAALDAREELRARLLAAAAGRRAALEAEFDRLAGRSR